MGRFLHSPDNVIYITNGSSTSTFPLSFFLTLVPAYVLPVGAIMQEYIQGSFHTSTNGLTTSGQDFPWTDGDTYIANESAYAAAYASYLNPAPSLPQAKNEKISEMMSYAFGIKNGNVIISGNTFSSANEFFTKIQNEYSVYSIAGGLPIGYYVNDINYNQIAISLLPDLEAIISRIVELWYLTDVNIDVHRNAINVLTTVEDVEAYDYSSGWQTVPY